MAAVSFVSAQSAADDAHTSAESDAPGDTAMATSDGDQERITRFFSDVHVQANGDLLVTEHIQVNSTRQSIQRGLLRDFPTMYRTPQGLTVRVDFEVLSVSRDGRPEPFATSDLANGVRIRTGQADVLLSRGLHNYAIRYRTSRQIGFFGDFDELYWNVTGTAWTFPIEWAGVRISLPAQAQIGNTALYTGPQGARGLDAREVSREPGAVLFETTRPLGVGEGLTVAAAWPKGVVNEPDARAVLGYWVRDNGAAAWAVLGSLGLLCFYIFTVRRGRRRHAPVIVPLYSPPEGMSAAAVHYFVHRRTDQQTFTLAMLELISRRDMRMTRQADGKILFERDSTDGCMRDTADVLAEVRDTLFGKKDRFVRDGVEVTHFGRAQDRLVAHLKQRWSPLFLPRREWAHRGALLWLGLVVSSLLLSAWLHPPSGISNTVGVVFAVVPLLLITLMVRHWRDHGFRLGSFLLTAIFLAPFALGGLLLILQQAAVGPAQTLPALLPLMLLPVVVFGYRFLARYTEQGDAVMDHIEGFRTYLRVAEGPRLAAMTTPEDKLAEFERYLPYAVALGVGKDWSKAFRGFFDEVGARAMAESMQRRYGGHDLLRRDPERTCRQLSGDVDRRSDASTRTASSSGSPGTSSSRSGRSSSSSSSGSSGRGSSGGGGGGGGGSGW